MTRDHPDKHADLERIIEGFELAWQAGRRPTIEDLLPHDPEQRRRAACELAMLEIEFRLRAGEAARCEEYFARFPELAGDVKAAAALAAFEFQQRLRLEPGLEPADQFRRFPQFASQLANLLATTGDGMTRRGQIASLLSADSVEAGSQAPSVEWIGRYRIERPVGQGGFGIVYLAHDEQLNRPIAIKVPHARRILRPEDTEAYLSEARRVANLDHPNIVPVFDVGSTAQFPCYIVSKYIDGTDLATRLRSNPPPLFEATELVATVAAALHYAHTCRLVHRDVKPGNILLDKSGKPFVADFGLAVQDQDFGKGPRYAGTPAYMSPEQARGEGHRVDGRSDVFSLGVVFYELLACQRPFKAETVEELLELISRVEVRPPRQIHDQIPKELERICLRALAKRATERYTTAKDFADDLQHWLSTASAGVTIAHPAINSGTVPTPARDMEAIAPARTVASPASDHSSLKIVPKGLRSFDAHDADFFLELLPGARDRDGLPESIRFWKTRIDVTDSDEAFCVGLIYGPSGCGKSSLVKAGLIPRLSRDVVVVYVDATATETETRLLSVLRKRCTELTADLDLKESLAAIRRGLPEGKRVLLVVDQFEQWLHAKRDEEETALAEALRQCDGLRVQCLLMVRDDFWMAATRFMRAIEIRLLEGQNSAAVDRFPIRHAEKVLAALGRAMGALPEKTADATAEQQQFVTRAVAGLAEDGKVVCVRLALFAEMMKNKPWTAASLAEVGGTEGVGVAFLEETFSSPSAPPEHRYFQKAARAVLKDLMPDSGVDLKGHMRSHAELLTASGLGGRTDEFDDLLRILDSEVRLITPTDPASVIDEGVEGDTKRTSNGAADGLPTAPRYYQLTHDYLVPAIRDWLTRKQRETRRGRAELRLAERSAEWTMRRENRNLPTLAEFIRIRLLTKRASWSQPQRQMMARAGRVYGVRAGIAAILLAIATVMAIVVRDRVITGLHMARAEAAVNSLERADIVQVPDLLAALKEVRAESVPLLEKKFEQAGDGSDARLYTALALVPSENAVNYLLSRLFTLSPQQFRLVVDALPPFRDQMVARAQVELTRRPEPNASVNVNRPEQQAKAAVVLIGWKPSEQVWPLLRPNADPTVRSFVIHLVGPLGVEPHVIIERWSQEPDVGIRAALTLMLGEFTEMQLPFVERQPLIDQLATIFETDPDPGLHSAAEWLLRQWGQEQRLQVLTERLRAKKALLPMPSVADKRKWFVNTQGQTFVILDASEFMMGSPVTDPDRFANETQHRVHIRRRVAIATTHVTKAQYREFQRAVKGENLADNRDLARTVTTEDSPQTAVVWYEAARFCNWLSERERIPPDQWCYEPDSSGQFRAKMKPKDKYLELTGYRLPTEAEWEYACRAGSDSSRYYGQIEGLLEKYAYYGKNGNGQTHAVGRLKPNDFGLFDMLGNALEWCDDLYRPDLQDISEDSGSTKLVLESEVRVLRGGSFDNNARSMRSAFRTSDQPSHRTNLIGFRPARTIP